MSLYPHLQKVISDFGVDIQQYISMHEDEAIMNNTPRISSFVKMYGVDKIAAIIRVHLLSLEAYSGVKKASELAMNKLSTVIATKYDFLKMTEFILFITEFEAGKYGSFYGMFDPVLFCSKLNEFQEQLNSKKAIIIRHQNRALQQPLCIPEGFTSLSWYNACKAAKSENNKEFFIQYKKYIKQ